MKKPSIFSLLAILLFCLLLAKETIPQGVGPPPPPPDTHGESGDKEGGGAPIGGGTLLLIALGTAYGTKKYIDARKQITEEMED